MQDALIHIPTTFERDGFALLPRAGTPSQIAALAAAAETARTHTSPTSPGLRHLLSRSEDIRTFANSSPALSIAATILGPSSHPVRAILFDKTPASNWYVTWHQDLTIPVSTRIDIPGYGPWSVKHGIIHVQPPAAVLESMVSLRIHIDSCPAENGAIKFIPGSHLLGILDPPQIESHKNSSPTTTCPAEPGDIIIMRPLILHSSSNATTPASRRVLHIEYASAQLPPGITYGEA